MPLTGEYEPSTSEQTRKQVETYEATGGKKGNTIMGLPVVIVTMRGATSGKLRKIALMRVEHDGEYALVASMGGAPKNPLWYNNIVAHPEVELQDGETPRDFVAREVFGEEKELWWERSVAAFPQYASYRLKTDRDIPVFVLSLKA